MDMGRFDCKRKKYTSRGVHMQLFSHDSISKSDLRHGEWRIRNDLGIKGRSVVPFQPLPAILSSWILIFALF